MLATACRHSRHMGVFMSVCILIDTVCHSSTGNNDCEPTFMGEQLGYQIISERVDNDGPCRVSMNLVGSVCEGHSGACQAFLRNKQSRAEPPKFWTGFGAQRPHRDPPASLQLSPTPKVAVCIAGVARTIPHPVVHASWGNFLGNLGPAHNRMLFMYLKLADAKIAADKQHTHDTSISHSSSAELEPALQALRDAGETIAAVKIDRIDQHHPSNPSCPLLATDGKTPYTTTPQHLLASLDSLEQCFALIETYEVQHGMRFDVVAYQRPDLTWVRPLPLIIGQWHARSDDVALSDSSLEMRDEIVLSCPRPADPQSRGVLCDVAAVMPRHHASLYFKRKSAYYGCTQPTIYCLAIAYDFGLPATFANKGAAVRFLDVPAVIVRSEGSSLWARNSCSARQNATGLSTAMCLAEIYQNGNGNPSSRPRGQWWPPASPSSYLDTVVATRWLVVVSEWVPLSGCGAIVLLLVRGKRERRVCKRWLCRACSRAAPEDSMARMGKV